MHLRDLKTKTSCLPKVGLVYLYMMCLLFKLLQSLLFTALYTPIRSPSLYVLTAPSDKDQHVSRGNVPLNTRALQGSGKSWLSFHGQSRVFTSIASFYLCILFISL